MLEQLQQAIQYSFTNPVLLQQSMTHSSAANEQVGHKEHNERLEFLGDAVLELCVSSELYTRFPSAREGLLTAMRSKMVNQDILAQIGRNIKLEENLILGKGEESQGGRERDSVLSDALEALLGAIYLDGGMEEAKRVVFLLFLAYWPRAEVAKKSKDAKSRLQEISQHEFKDRPKYSVKESYGPEHAKEFTVQLDLPDGRIFLASGSSVKRAEQAAALQALAFFQENAPQEGDDI